MLRLNGVARDGGVAPFDLSDRGLTLGDGLFETIAVFGGRPAALDAHLDRMMAAAAEIRLPLSREFLREEVLALLGGVDGDAVIRLTVTRGGGARGLGFPERPSPQIVAALGPRPPGALGDPIRLATVAVRRNPTSFASRAKTLSYLDGVLAYEEARAAGADDALMLNAHGRVGSTAMANLFAVIGGDLVTPPVTEGVLPGIMRGMALALGADLGLQAVERPIRPDELAGARALFATNSVRLAMPVIAVDGAPSPDPEGFAGRVGTALRAACGAGPA